MLYFCPFSFLSLKPPLWTGSQKRPSVERRGCREYGEGDQAGPGEVGSYVGQGGRKGKVKGIVRAGLGRVQGSGHECRSSQQAFLDIQHHSCLSSGFKLESESQPRVPYLTEGLRTGATRDPGHSANCEAAA